MSTSVIYVYTVHCTVYRRRISFFGCPLQVALCRLPSADISQQALLSHPHPHEDRLTRANKDDHWVPGKRQFPDAGTDELLT